MTHASSTAASRARFEDSRDPKQLRDVLWDRPVFRAPPLINPQVIFDPLPFWALVHPERRLGELAACRPLRAA